MQDLELYNQIKLINSKQISYAKYVVSSDKPDLLKKVRVFLSQRTISLDRLTRSIPLPRIIADDGMNLLVGGKDSSVLNQSCNQGNAVKILQRQSIPRNIRSEIILPSINPILIKRSMIINNQTGMSKLFLTALHLQNSKTLLSKFRSVARSVWIFLSFFRWIAKNAKLKLQWSWAYDPKTYTYQNPFKDIEKFSENISINQHSSNGLEFYSGWLCEDIRVLLRIPPSERTDRHIDILMKYFSSMKSFKKYNAQSRKEFLSRGVYNSWEKGRHIIKEGYPALAVYFILDGEISISKIIGSSQEDKQTETTSKAHRTVINENMVPIMTLTSGDSFGEVAFTLRSNHTRAATATTLKNTEFLLIQIQDAAHIITTHNDNAFTRKVDFISSLPLLRTLRVDARTLAYYCSFKSASVNSPLLIEGENSQFMYFVKSGVCRLLKTVQITKMKNGTVSLRTLDGKNHTVSGIDETSPHVTYHLVVMGKLSEGDHFGEGYVSESYDPLKILSGTVGVGNSRFSVVSNSRIEILCVPKLEFYRFATEETWEYLLFKDKEVSPDHFYVSYEKVLKWTELKSKICKELTPHYSI